MRTGKTFFLTVSCGLVLLGAVAAHAGSYSNAIVPNALSPNGISNNALIPNGITGNALQPNGLIGPGLPPERQSENLPWNSLSQQPLGKSTR